MQVKIVNAAIDSFIRLTGSRSCWPSLRTTGWMVAYRETASPAKQSIEHSCEKQWISPGQLTIPPDRGSSMPSKSPALLLADLGVVTTLAARTFAMTTHFSEAHFKTMK